jgi:hypothetical protein
VISNLHNNFAEVAASALVGGTVSELAGGKFGNGAVTGAFQMAFNKLAHKIHTTDAGVMTLELSPENDPNGYASADVAADAQFDAYATEHAATKGTSTELKGAIISKGKKFYFTTMHMGPSKWNGVFAGGGSIKNGYSWAAFTHTHPDNTTFNGVDFENVVGTKRPGYVRRLDGRMDRWDVSGAKRYMKSFNRTLETSVTGNAYEEVIADPASWGISNVCPVGGCK